MSGGTPWTPAPWVVEDDWLQSERGACIDGRYFSICVSQTRPEDLVLIKAAPEMAEALQELVDWLTDNQRTIDGEFSMDELLAKPRTLLTKIGATQ